ncbi:MAG TPA: hypothetical protein P5250_02580 [Bacteroidales bacterium]|nr:hypothetical protein [Bacteroidales bacterium]
MLNILKIFKDKTFTSKLILLLAVMSSLFLVLSIYFYVQLIKANNNIEKEVIIKESSISDKEKMIIKLKTLELEYDELMKEYTGLDSLFVVEKKKVTTLLNEIKNLKQSSAITYKNKVIELETRLFEYMQIIKDLQTKNEGLTFQNLRLNKELDSALNLNYKLSSNNQELVSVIEKGSKMKAYDIIAEGIRIRSGNKEIGTNNTKKVQKFRICFLLAENPIVKPGRKTIYIRISEPDGSIISNSANDLFTFENHDIVYTIKDDIVYNNKAMDICLYWDKDRTLKKGNYEVFIFLDNQEIGRTVFTLE